MQIKFLTFPLSSTELTNFNGTKPEAREAEDEYAQNISRKNSLMMVYFNIY